jgi:hypothetical protein
MTPGLLEDATGVMYRTNLRNWSPHGFEFDSHIFRNLLKTFWGYDYYGEGVSHKLLPQPQRFMY